MLASSTTTPLAAVQALEHLLSQKIIGQPLLVNRLLIALLADGHLLVEGAPGLAKTRAVKTLAQHLAASFHRVQFTPDLLPADLTGTEIYRPQTGTFELQKGPLFHPIVLADEINRAPAKVQSALLEAMAERQITIHQETHTLPEVFLVMATQNSLEQEGTYPLPEAQLDRFLMRIILDYPDETDELAILQLAQQEAEQQAEHQDSAPLLSLDTILAARAECLAVHLAPNLEHYIVQLIVATRNPERYDTKWRGLLQYGASPRGSIALARAAKAFAWLAGRDYVSPNDIQTLAPDVLNHRIILSFDAEAQEITPHTYLNELLNAVPVP